MKITCPKCGYTSGTDDLFCMNCGEKLTPELKELDLGEGEIKNLSPIIKCPKCKMRILPNLDGTCPSCHSIIFQNGKVSLSKSIEPEENHETSKYLEQRPSTVTKLKSKTGVADSRSVTRFSALTKLKGKDKGNLTVLLTGLFLFLTGFLLFVSILLHFPSNLWNQASGEVRWYKIDGLKTINNEILPTYSIVQPEKGDPTNEELTKLAIDWDPSFFTGSQTNKRVSLGVLPGSKGYDFRIYLVGKLSGKVDKSFYFALSAYEVIPNPNSRNGYYVASGIVLFGLVLIIMGRKKAMSAKNITF
jgi:DNA-directed RNA polymerase subunit RPC12/RpoP